MFKSLRRKFVAAAVASVTVVIILMASTLNLINYYKVGQRVDDSLYEASKSSALTTIFAEIMPQIHQTITVFQLLKLMKMKKLFVRIEMMP